jgi:hypothetical protein
VPVVETMQVEAVEQTGMAMAQPSGFLRPGYRQPLLSAMQGSS